MRVLKASWDPLIFFFVARKLDLDTKEWEEKTITSFDRCSKYSDFINFLTKKCRALETTEPTSKQVRFNHNKPAQDKIVSNAATLSNGKCYFCKGTHYIYRRFKWLALSVSDIFKEVKRLKLCTNCLRSNHFVSECVAVVAENVAKNIIQLFIMMLLGIVLVTRAIRHLGLAVAACREKMNDCVLA